MSEVTRREFLARAGGMGLVVMGSGGILAACNSAVGPQASSSQGSASQSPTTGEETTWQRILRTKTVQVGYTNEPPFTFVGDDGQLTGQAPEVLRLCMKVYGVTDLVGVQVDFAGLIPALVSKRFDIASAGVAVTPPRCELIAFGSVDILTREALLVVKGNPNDFHSFEDIAKSPSAKLGFVAATADIPSAGIAGISDARVVLFPDVPTAVAGLAAGRCDAFASNTPTLNSLLQKPGSENLELAKPFKLPIDKDGNPLEFFGAAAFRLEDTDFVEAYDVEMAKITANGELAKIADKFGFGAENAPTGPISVADICAGKHPAT